ncbi:GTP-binding protein [Cryptosporidium bovis]|uniref:GTP-binding protein n=1 Tax=Cryptosporidium bovis TaxID=310047 RepID=UPI00351A25B1|nr:GTP-binding protein [Cryptosporidium bovis]
MSYIRKEYVVGCVGKPSSGKSTFFAAVTETAAKIGNYPFTTIEPNIGIAHYITRCPCKKFNVFCKPVYGHCDEGFRYIPIKLIDIAGLIPGAHKGIGLGNKFLDDLRTAHVLLHIIDVSGNTNEKGEETINYNPIYDHDWLCTEIEMWIFNNIYSNWSSITRKSKSSNSTVTKLLLSQFSGYGCNESMILELVLKLKLNDLTDFSTWDKDNIINLVREFIKIRFPFVIVLNKSDIVSEQCDSNIVSFYEKYSDKHKIVIASSLAEYFIKKMARQNYIKLVRNGETYNYDSFLTSEELNRSDNVSLKKLDYKQKNRLNNIRDMVLFRHGVTGVQDAINTAIEMLDLIPVFPVKNLKNFSNNTSNDETTNCAFQECILVPNCTPIKNLAKLLLGNINKKVTSIETVGGIQVSENQVISKDLNIIKINTETC